MKLIKSNKPKHHIHEIRFKLEPKKTTCFVLTSKHYEGQEKIKQWKRKVFKGDPSKIGMIPVIQSFWKYPPFNWANIASPESNLITKPDIAIN